MSQEIKICPFPFSRIELGHLYDTFIPCCSAWLTKEYHEKFKIKDLNRDLDKGYDHIWNSDQAIELRKSILDGSYKYCNVDRCNKPQLSISEVREVDLEYFETPISNYNQERILNRDPYMIDGPSSVSLSGDFKCNLKCPTCRDDFQTTSDEREQKVINSEIEYMKNNKENLEVIKLANSGEAFFSKDQRELIRSINRFDYPKIRYIFIITNGLLFDQRNYDMLFPGSSFIKKITVSMDAGDKETYAITRGGDWDRLIKNLDWMADMKRSGNFLTVGMNFVVRKANYKSIDNFVNIARQRGFDRIEFTKYDDWVDLYDHTLSLSNQYNDEAIHLKEHPQHKELVKILQKYKDDSDVLINIDGLF